MATPASGLLLGAHVSTAGGVDKAPANATEIGAECMQIFTRNQRQWASKPIAPARVTRFREELTHRGIGPVMVHDGYLINLSARDPENLERSRAAMIDELRRADLLEIPVLVMHPGSHLGLGLSAGIAAFVQNLDRCIDDAAPEGGVNIALENTAGQGTNLGWELSQLRDMIAASNHGARLGICLDTCHAFAAGYELRGPESYQRFIEELDRVVGTDRVKGLHLNDSKTPLGSRRDRHAELGTGHLGLEPFRAIVNDPLWAGLAGCLETPGGPQKWKIELEVLKSMRSVNMPR